MTAPRIHLERQSFPTNPITYILDTADFYTSINNCERKKLISFTTKLEVKFDYTCNALFMSSAMLLPAMTSCN